METSDSVANLAAALVAAQAEMKNPLLDARNPHFKNRYASLLSVRQAVLPTLAKHGIAVVQGLGRDDAGVTCETRLLHASGEWVATTLALPVAKADAQAYGSAATYARRYSLMAVCGVVGDEDDDATAAAGPAAASEKLSDAQREALQREIAAAGVDASKVLAWVKAASFDDVTPGQFAAAMQALAARRKTNDKKQQF